MPEEKFEGFFLPEEKLPLTEQQIERFNGLPKGIVKEDENGKKRFEELIGNVTISSAKDTAPAKLITNPSSLLNFVRNVAKENDVSPWEVTQAIRTQGVDNPEKLKEIEKTYAEKIGYVSDIHGGGDLFFGRLEEMANNPPDVAIFGGDIIGTDAFTNLQRLFYNWVNNHSKNEILKDNPHASDQEILSYQGTKPPEENFNLKKGFLKLREYELNLAGKNPDEITQYINGLTDHDIAEEIRRYAKYVHYGHYASNLPIETRSALAAGLEENAGKTLSYIKRMQEKGTNVAIIEGNWDARSPIDFVPEMPTAIPLDPGKRLFRPQEFFESNGVPFFDKLNYLETDTSIQILLPFDAITNFSSTPQDRLDYINNAVRKARQDKKSVVMVSHGQPNWKIHRLTIDNPTPTGEHAEIVSGLRKAISTFRPDEIVYGHMHDVITDEEGNKLDANIKYALKITSAGEVELAEQPDEFSEGQTVGSYMQIWKTAESRIPRKDTKRKIKGFGGNRQPMKLKQPS